MTAVPPSEAAVVEKTLFPAQPTNATARPTATSIPVPAPNPVTRTGSSASAAPAVAAVPAPTTAAASLSQECAARVSTVIVDDLRQLSRDDLDVKRWLNATLSRVLEAAKDADAAAVVSTRTAEGAPASAVLTRRPQQVEEQLVQLLHARVQSHAQELSAGIEDLISSTLVRLPRTTMELTRMSAEAEELTSQLQRIEGIVAPAVSAGSGEYVTQLHTRKASEEKLRKCMRLLEKAARVEENIRNIQYLVDHRESMARTAGSAKGTPPVADTDQKRGADAAAKPNGSSTASRQRDLDEVAGIIRQAREDLKEITAVDDTFGEQYRAQLEQFEQYIEHALEEECVACLRAHQLERATRLITTLHSIGRADAVLKRYGEQAAAQMVEAQERKLQAAAAGVAVTPTNTSGSSSPAKPASSQPQQRSAAAAVAELLRSEIIPDDSAFLSRELTFLSSLVQQAAGGVRAAADASSASSTTGGEGGNSSKGGAPPSTSSSLDALTTTPHRGSAASGAAAGAVASSGSRAVDEDPRAAQVLDVLAVLLKQLHAPVHAALRPLLTERPDTTNADFVACFTAIQQIKITTGATTAATTTAAAAAGASAGGAGTATASLAKDPLEKLAREVTHRALTLFASLFQEEKVLQRYADRVCTPVNAYCQQPLSKLLAAPPTTSAAASSAAEEGSLSQVLLRSIQDVLVYVPERISARCTTAWHDALSKALIAQLKPTSSTSQHLLLQCLYLHRQRIKPLLAKAQQTVDDWLSSGAARERYPAGAGLLREDLQSRVWTPLKAEAEASQEAIQRGILSGIIQPILAKVADYPQQPCWRSASRDGGAAGAPPGAAAAAVTGPAKPMGLYSQGQVAPSSAVRDMGEMLMELPLTLETLGSTAVAESYQRSSSSGGSGGSATAVLAFNDTEAEEGVRMLIDEQAEEWLETVVRDVVHSFLNETVLPLEVGPFSSGADAAAAAAATAEADSADQQRAYAMALEQLTTDLDYVRNILSAVNEESQETVERVLSAVRALPTTTTTPFVVGEAVHMASCSTDAAVREEDNEEGGGAAPPAGSTA